MHLTGEEERMCAGEEGSAVQMAMGLLVALGRIYEAPRMVRIASAHASARTYKIGGDDKIRWMQELVDKGGRFRVLTTVNPGGVDFDRWQQMGVPETLAENQARADRPYIDLGVVPIGTCLPYMHGNAPRFGEHFSWGGSSGQIFANSVLGGRGTRDGAPAVIAAAITGRTPAYGLHLTENRRGQVLVDASRLDFGQMTRADYGALGYFLGSILGDRIPVMVGFPPDIGQDELRALMAPMPTGGSVTLCHVVGVTPEAPTVEVAFGGLEPPEKMSVGPVEIARGREMLTTTTSDTVDAVVFGCPHCSYSQVRHIADLLDGKRINGGVRLWVSTSRHIRELAERTGLVTTIEHAGGLVLADACIGPGAPFELIDSVNTVATGDGRAAYYLPGTCGVGVLFGSPRQCIEAALTGTWRA